MGQQLIASIPTSMTMTTTAWGTRANRPTSRNGACCCTSMAKPVWTRVSSGGLRRRRRAPKWTKDVDQVGAGQQWPLDRRPPTLGHDDDDHESDERRTDHTPSRKGQRLCEIAGIDQRPDPDKPEPPGGGRDGHAQPGLGSSSLPARSDVAWCLERRGTSRAVLGGARRRLIRDARTGRRRRRGRASTRLGYRGGNGSRLGRIHDPPLAPLVLQIAVRLAGLVVPDVAVEGNPLVGDLTSAVRPRVSSQGS